METEIKIPGKAGHFRQYNINNILFRLIGHEIGK